MGFEDLLPLIAEGAPVSPGVANAPIQGLDQKIRYLYDLIQAATIGSTVYARQRTVEPAALVGMPVFWNTATAQFERALARTEAMPTNGALVTSESARVWGIIANKSDATLADILLFGYAPIDISAAVGSTPAPGVYYLSATTPGGLTQQRPPVSIVVLRVDGDGNVFLTPQFVDFLERHVHYKFALHCVPAGSVTPPEPGGTHTIDDPDTTRPGWLPAFDPIFQDRAPAGAAFGYNLSAHPDLNNIWPPIPTNQATLEWDRGIDKDVAATTIPPGLCVMDRNGIWWMSDCYGDVPWPTTLNTAASESSSASASVSEIVCPRELAMSLTLWFTRLNFASDLVAVTSLHPGDDRIIISCLNGTPGTMGDLQIALNLDWVSQSGAAGYQVFKGLNGNTFSQGPVCEGIYSTSPNVTLSGATTRPLSNSEDAPTLYQGPVQIQVSLSPTQELEVQTYRLDQIEQEYFDDVPYLGFQPGQVSALRGLIYVPADTQIVSPQLALRFVLLGRVLGTLPELTITARRLPRPSAGLTPVQLPTDSDEFAVTIDTTGTLTASNQYVEAVSTPFAVDAGDVVLFALTRSAADSYSAEVGLLYSAGILSPGT